MRSVELWVGLVYYGARLWPLWEVFTSVPERGGGGGFSISAVGRVPGKERPVPSCYKPHLHVPVYSELMADSKLRSTDSSGRGKRSKAVFVMR